MHILLVEDDVKLGPLIVRLLAAERNTVELAATGADGIAFWESKRWDLVILDRMLPDLEGASILRDRRRAGDTTPVLMLTAMGTVDDRVEGLDSGADDYLTKPFDLPELEARVRALLRRGSAQTSPILEYGSLRLDTVGRRVHHEDRPVELSARELAVLEVLLLRAGRVVSKEHIASHLYGWGDDVGLNAIEVYVHRIRKKVEPLGCEIRTIRGMGYLVERIHAPA